MNELNALNELIKPNELNELNSLLAFNLSQAAESIDVSRPTMSALVRTEGFPAFRIGSQWRIPVEAFREWLNKQAADQRVFVGLNEPKIQ